MNRVNEYLKIPSGFFSSHETLVGLRWSANGDAVEFADGSTFVLTHEIALFLEGFIGQRRLIHFAYILVMLNWLNHPPSSAGLTSDYMRPLREPFQRNRRPLRNAGVFCALLCRSVPPVADPVDVDRLSRLWVSNSSLMSLLCAATESDTFAVPEEPPLGLGAFCVTVFDALNAFTPDEFDHWLRHGRGPVVEAGEPLAEEMLAAKPRSLASVLAELTQRGRLSGAVPFVEQMVGVLSLPPRRLTPSALPVDGYTDVTTRGQPEHLLPSQFALDDLEFVRRFAAKELLFFRREEPHAPLREELLLLLDQGVRTWGDVRLVLAAAVFALGRRCVRRDTPLHLATTGKRGELLDFRSADTEALGALLESSDLTPNPALALERVLERPADGSRDVVLLTHPRNLNEPDVQDAARRAAGPTRLFAVTVDEQGRAEFAEVRHGAAVLLCRFRIDWTRALPPDPSPEPPLTGWQGNVEPVGFPFRFGISGKVKHFAFDEGGTWILIASQNGMLHLERVDGTHPEVLPRGWMNDVVLSDVEALLGVPGGFVVGGRIETELVAFHYDLTSRTCTARILGVPTQGTRQWYYFHRYHSVAVQAGEIVYGVDLGTGQRGSQTPGGRPGGAERVMQACAEAAKYRVPPPWALTIMETEGVRFFAPTFVVNLRSDTGRLVMGTFLPQAQFRTPMSDGKPVLQHCRLLAAQVSGDTLALVSSPQDQLEPLTLRLLRRHDGVPLTEFPHHEQRGFFLSPDGGRLAGQTGLSQVTVQHVTGGPPCWVSPKGKCHHDVSVQLGQHWLSAHAGGYHHLLCWDRDRVNHHHSSKDAMIFLQQYLSATHWQARYRTVRTLEESCARAWYDFRRFRQAVPGLVTVVVDVYGQIMVWSRAMELLCMFFVFRDKLAAWMPDGTRYGPPSLTGGPATVGALERIGRTLRAASEAGRVKV